MALNRKIAYIDLSKKKIDISTIPAVWRRRFIGGRGLDAYLLYQHMPAGCDPLKPGNPMVISAGLFGGTLVSADTVTGIAAKSPLTNRMEYSTFNGLFASEMRWAGFDHILIKGRSKNPVYLFIQNGTIEIRDADGIWGQNIPDTQKSICKEIHADDCRMICIGPAGENKIRYANIITDRGDAAGRTGMGAVLGSKNIKGIACTGNMDVEIKHPEEVLKWQNEKFKSVDGEGEFRENNQEGGLFSKESVLCREFGMDLKTVDAILNWIFVLYEQEIITDKKTKGLRLNRDNHGAAHELVRQIASKEGFGKILAEGPLMAAKKIGKNALEYFGTMDKLAEIYMERKPEPLKQINKPEKKISINDLPATISRRKAIHCIMDNLAINSRRLIGSDDKNDLNMIIRLIELNTGMVFREKDLIETAYRGYAVERLLCLREDDASKNAPMSDQYLSVPDESELFNNDHQDIDLKHFKGLITKYYGARHWNKSNMVKLKIFESLEISDLWPHRAVKK